ncbi:sigma-70 family RNA polymerase sigma factor [Aureibaculum algae]|uniref:Sigma-70 family RNA polymerase sigma factor n=1 Tax=Aureibaculum algae TaxID=2584122 RepID=A0A5B7TNV5_9FLAO|nr:sigma-70 family RNA polymerase sigma factor [Aureibaculum algae]QCX38345.1 sigma-70 family RNA polymerase sigma factor [Aureibaculum algae]
MTDQEIIIQLKKGNESCLKHLYVHLDMVKGWVNNNNGNDDDAFDIFQEAMMVFYKNLISGKYESSSKISTYLFGICKRQWLNQLNRRLKYEKPSDIITSTEDKGDDGFEIEFTIGRESLKNYINKALDKLGEPCKELLEKSIFLKLRMKELAEMFDYSSAHSARQQKLRCIKRLRGYMSYELIIKLK